METAQREGLSFYSFNLGKRLKCPRGTGVKQGTTFSYLVDAYICRTYKEAIGFKASFPIIYAGFSGVCVYVFSFVLDSPRGRLVVVKVTE